ncbi:cytochrome P450 6a14 [Apis mellifera caucasica]|uniref:Probable cytochrome P450 6a14 n=1 Tax=Apis mellifera TaxID=7460 RepID=A0A7M7MSS6_APIME|nr:probable cytochrome P450 6a14 [Apis mellifera]KAG6800704.1 cytochrome P450 6a14 [Apis mellifera caucasica]|eukprot:XP_026300530.1 probable cytochrome P450 6a14 [Apis mellifera]
MIANLEIFCGIIVIVIAFYYYITARNNFWKIRGIPGPEPLPGFGNVLMIVLGKEAPFQFLTRVYNEFKNEALIGVFMKTYPALVVKDPDLIKDIMIKDFYKFPNRGFPKSDSADPLTQHLFLVEEEKWRPLRTQLSPVFSTGKLRGTFTQILDCSNHLVTYMDKLVEIGEPIDVREVTAKFTTDVIGSCVFGIKMNSLSGKESEFRRFGRQIFAMNFLKILRLRIKQFLPMLHYLLVRILPPDEETKIMLKLTRDTFKFREAHNIVRPDFMNILMELKKHPEKVPSLDLTDGLLAAQAFIFFAAGFETSSTTVANTLYELALNPDIQEKLRQEIKEFEANNDGEWKYETIQEMKYLDKTFKETLRKYPVLPYLSRRSIEDYTFEGTKVSIPKNTLICIPVYPIHHDSSIYPNPEKFDPERFSEDEVKKRHSMHYFPFGHGPRNCIGLRFAIYQSKIALIKILSNYKIEICDKTLIPYKYDPFSFISLPLTGIFLKITKLQN